MTTDGKTKVWGIIADPVEHSMSPVLQNCFAERTGVNGVYVPFRVHAEDVEAALKGAHSLHIQGLNVTVPHKQRVIDYLAQIDETAAAVGAVNTLVYTREGYKGYNTDVPGLFHCVQEAGFPIEGQDCILIGAGGAAKAAAYMLLQEKAARIYLLNRTVERAASLACELNCKKGWEHKVIPLALSDYERIPEGRYLAVQSTTVGMDPHTGAAPIEDPAFYRKISRAVDVIYTPAETEFMRRVREAGGTAVNGLAMLIYQGLLSFKLWNPGVIVGQETVREAAGRIESLLREKKYGKQQADGRLILIGFMGTGKTSVGAAYAKRHGLPMLDTDKVIEKKAGMSVSAIFSSQGEEAFRQMETKVLRELCMEGGSMVLSSGGGLPMRAENRELLRRMGTVVCLKASPDTILERIGEDCDRPLLQGREVRQRVEQLMAEREPVYESAAHYFITVDGKSVEEVVQAIEEKAES